MAKTPRKSLSGKKAQGAPATKTAAAKSPLRSRLAMLPTESLVPNAWNPNRMRENAFAEYVAEVRRLGRLPKPIVCRPVGDKFEIIDGEHGWRAAKEIGLVQIQCEVLDGADAFEAMRQTYKRNRGGRDNPVLLGRMFEQMTSAQNLSIRRLAEKINIPEATIRTHLEYVKAARVRSSCAGEEADSEIAELSHRELKLYMTLPKGIRDAWLDAGADLSDFDDLLDGDHARLSSLLYRSGLSEFAEPMPSEFRESVARLLRLARWWESHWKIRDLHSYLPPVAKLKLPALVLELLPLRTDERDDKPRVLLTPDQWTAIVTAACKHASNQKGIEAQIASGVRNALREASVDLQEVYGPQIVEVQQLVDDGPEFLRDADFLTLSEKAWLLNALAQEPAETMARAARLTVAYFEQRRGKPVDGQAGKHAGKGFLGDTVNEVFQRVLKKLVEEAALAEHDPPLADAEQLLKAILALATPVLDGALVDDKPAIDVLAERLGQLDSPEFSLLAACLLRSSCAPWAIQRWLQAARE